MERLVIGVIGNRGVVKRVLEGSIGASEIRNGVWLRGGIEFVQREVYDPVYGWKWNGVLFVDGCEKLCRERFIEIIQRLDWVWAKNI